MHPQQVCRAPGRVQLPCCNQRRDCERWQFIYWAPLPLIESNRQVLGGCIQAHQLLCVRCRCISIPKSWQAQITLDLQKSTPSQQLWQQSWEPPWHSLSCTLSSTLSFRGWRVPDAQQPASSARKG